MRKLLILSMLCWVGDLSAVPKPVTGLVLDAESHEPLPFTNIVVTGQVKGTVANVEGVYVLDMSDIGPGDSISFRHMGYETITVTAAQLQRQPHVHLKPAIINLSEVAIYSKDLTAEKIIELVRENYGKNYAEGSEMQRIFLHKYGKARVPLKDQVVMKKSDFAGFDRQIFNELLDELPEEFIEYQDVLLETYHHGGNRKLIPVEGISLEEGSMKDLSKAFEEKLAIFIEDIEKTKREKDTYYKFRTGIFAFDADIDSEGDTAISKQEEDSLYYAISTDALQSTLSFLKDEYASLDSDNWEFFTKTGKYKFALEETTIYNEELVYKIAFKPRRSGLFEGLMYVSAATFAVLQLDFVYAQGKSSENIQLLGVGHSMYYKKGRVIYERGKERYFLKYVYAEQHEKASIERGFSFIKKEKRFLWDKTLNEMKFGLELSLDIQSSWEMLVMDRKPITSQQYSKVQEPEDLKLRKEYGYSPEMWKNSTVIAPTAELKRFERKATE